MFKALKKDSRTDLIVGEIKSAILSGKYRIGDRLPPERELALQFEVSRTSVREAVKILSAYGMLRAVQGDGLYVTDCFTENMFEFLGYGGFLTADNYRPLYQARLVIETGSLMTALESVTDEEIQALETCVAASVRETDVMELQAIDARFHIMLVQFSRNPILTGMYSMLHKIMKNGVERGVSVYPDAKPIVVAEHRRIVRAIKSRSKPRVYKAIEEHLQGSRKMFDRIFGTNC